MKKIIFLLILICCLCINVNLAEANDLNLRAGITYNTYQLDNLNEFVEDRGGEKIEDGIGLILGLEREIYDNLFLGGELDLMAIKYDDLAGGNEVEAINTGILITASYRLFDNLRLNSAIGQYMAKAKYNNSEDIPYNIGFKVGAEGNIEISDITLGLLGNYRLVEVGDYDFSGLETSLTVGMKF